MSPQAILEVKTHWRDPTRPQDLRSQLDAARMRAPGVIFAAVERGVRIIDTRAHQTINKSGRSIADRPTSRPFATEETIQLVMPFWDGAGRVRGMVISDDQIAAILELGSEAHVISPRVARALKFRLQGRTVFATHVNHPGTRAYRWLERAGIETQAEVLSELSVIPERIFGRRGE